MKDKIKKERLGCTERNIFMYGNKNEVTDNYVHRIRD